MALRDQLRVMVVDDMSTSRGLLVQALEAFGIKFVFFASDGTTALQLMERSPVHLVISDFNMPNMDGLQLLRAIRSNKRNKKTGFILITGLAEQKIIETGKKLGMNNFIRKPFQPNDLKNCIEAVVGRL